MEQIYFKTPKQLIMVTPIAYVGDVVTCDIIDTEITIEVDIKQLEFGNGVRVTRKILSKLWEA